jgi:hypothetical protein
VTLQFLTFSHFSGSRWTAKPQSSQTNLVINLNSANIVLKQRYQLYLIPHSHYVPHFLAINDLPSSPNSLQNSASGSGITHSLPRIIHLLGHASGEHCNLVPPDSRSLSPYPPSHPASLSVCQESRAYALQFYAIIYGPRRLCLSFDNSIDTVVVGHKECPGSGHDVTPKTFEKKGYTSLKIGKGALEGGVRVKKMVIRR